MKIAGATVFRGLEGYGETAEMHKSHLTRRDQPIVISIVDSADNLARLAPVVEEMMDTGLLAVSDVRVVRVQKHAWRQDRMRQAIESRQNTVRPLPLVGRQRGVRELIAALRTGQPRLIVGPAGIGKKRLVEEALQAAEQPFVRVRAAGVLHELLADLAAALGCSHPRFPPCRKPPVPRSKGSY